LKTPDTVALVEASRTALLGAEKTLIRYCTARQRPRSPVSRQHDAPVDRFQGPWASRFQGPWASHEAAYQQGALWWQGQDRARGAERRGRGGGGGARAHGGADAVRWRATADASRPLSVELLLGTTELEQHGHRLAPTPQRPAPQTELAQRRSMELDAARPRQPPTPGSILTPRFLLRANGRLAMMSMVAGVGGELMTGRPFGEQLVAAPPAVLALMLVLALAGVFPLILGEQDGGVSPLLLVGCVGGCGWVGEWVRECLSACVRPACAFARRPSPLAIFGGVPAAFQSPRVCAPPLLRPCRPATTQTRCSGPSRQRPRC
jgi:hypothetical protein